MLSVSRRAPRARACACVCPRSRATSIETHLGLDDLALEVALRELDDGRSGRAVEARRLRGEHERRDGRHQAQQPRRRHSLKTTPAMRVTARRALHGSVAGGDRGAAAHVNESARAVGAEQSGPRAHGARAASGQRTKWKARHADTSSDSPKLLERFSVVVFTAASREWWGGGERGATRDGPRMPVWATARVGHRQCQSKVRRCTFFHCSLLTVLTAQCSLLCSSAPPPSAGTIHSRVVYMRADAGSTGATEQGHRAAVDCTPLHVDHAAVAAAAKRPDP